MERIAMSQEERDDLDWLKRVKAGMIVLVGRDDSAFIPPLQLTKANAGNPRDLGTGVGLGFGRHKGGFSGSEHSQNTFSRACFGAL